VSRADDLQRRADTFADMAIAFVEGLPKTMPAQRIGGQLQLLDEAQQLASIFGAAARTARRRRRGKRDEDK